MTDKTKEPELVAPTDEKVNYWPELNSFALSALPSAELKVDHRMVRVDVDGNIVLPGNLIIVERRAPEMVEVDTYRIIRPSTTTPPEAPAAQDTAEDGSTPLGVDMLFSLPVPEPEPAEDANPKQQEVPPVTICPCDVTIESDP